MHLQPSGIGSSQKWGNEAEEIVLLDLYRLAIDSAAHIEHRLSHKFCDVLFPAVFVALVRVVTFQT